MGKVKSKDRQAGSSSRPVRQTSEASEASEAPQQQQEEQQGPQQLLLPPRPQAQAVVFSPSELRAAFATGSSEPDASIPLTHMLAYTYADAALQARMREVSPLMRHAIAYRSASAQERRRMREALPAVIEQEKRRAGSPQQAAFRRPYTAPKCPTRGVKVPGHETCRDRRCHCNTACTGGEDCVLCATYMSGHGSSSRQIH